MKKKLQRIQRYSVLTISIALFAVILTAVLAFGHGGKHSNQFTQLQALQKATQLYDQLIAKGKLDETWETGLQNVTISSRKREGKNEVIVSKAIQIFSPKMHQVRKVFQLSGGQTGLTHR